MSIKSGLETLSYIFSGATASTLTVGTLIVAVATAGPLGMVPAGLLGAMLTGAFMESLNPCYYEDSPEVKSKLRRNTVSFWRGYVGAPAMAAAAGAALVLSIGVPQDSATTTDRIALNRSELCDRFNAYLEDDIGRAQTIQENGLDAFFADPENTAWLIENC